MSKIYEALLRAEIERLATRDDSSARFDESPAGPAPTTSSAVTSSLAASSPAAFPQEVANWPPPAEETTAPSSSSSVFDHSKVTAVRWKPNLAQLPSLQERGSAVEQFRTLRSRVQEFRDLSTLKTVLVSSGLPGEGKSFISANLALSLARRKSNRVLLIDGDMRRSSLHKLLGAPCQPGLTDYLSGHATALSVMQRARPEEGIPPGLAALTFIAGGGDAANAADLSSSNRFAELIETVSPMFDWIVVDSSPVNVIADGVNLAHACDGVLLVARGGVTKFETAQRALSQLKASKVLGLVLNAVADPPVTGGYYGYDAQEPQRT